MLHKDISIGYVHPAHNWAVVDQIARLALSVTAADVGKLCWQQDTGRLYVLTDDSPMAWSQVGGSDYVLPTASGSVLGGVKVGARLSIDGGGVLSADVQTTGEANTASNLGTGSGVYAQKVGVDLQLKSLKAGTGVTLTPSATEIEIAASGGGGGIEPLAQFKKLKIVHEGYVRDDFTITAEEIIVKNVSDAAVILKNISCTIDIDIVGVGGLDAGTFGNTSGTWWYIWVIYNGTLTKTIASLSSTAPTMPSGYTYKALVGSFVEYINEASVGFIQRDNKVYCFPESVIIPANPASGSLVPSIARLIPPNATSIFGMCNHGSTAATALDLYLGVTTTPDIGWPHNILHWPAGADASFRTFDVGIKDSQVVRLLKTDTTTSLYFYVSGWRY